jgi:hypothetical protein
MVTAQDHGHLTTTAAVKGFFVAIKEDITTILVLGSANRLSPRLLPTNAKWFPTYVMFQISG